MATSRICSIPDCCKPVRTRGWCYAHYERWRHHGDPLKGRTSRGEPLAYFRKVVLPYSGEACLKWPYNNDGHGYGRVWYEGRMQQVARLVCTATQGEPLPFLEAAHSCGKGHEGCVNPQHITWKTHQANQKDRIAHGTIPRGVEIKSAKLTPKDVLEIRAAKGDHKVIAARYGVSHTSVYLIKRRKNWAWVES